MWNKVIKFILKHEGGYVDDPRDPGGETKFGISKRAFPHLNIKNLSEETAKEIYWRNYWIYPQINRLPWPLSFAVCDFAVNAGVKRSVMTLQRMIGTVPDGKIGPITLEAASRLPSRVLAVRYTKERILFYISLNKPRFFKGWLNRTFSLIEEI